MNKFKQLMHKQIATEDWTLILGVVFLAVGWNKKELKEYFLIIRLIS